MFNASKLTKHFEFWPSDPLLRRPILMLYGYIAVLILSSFIAFSSSNIKLAYKHIDGKFKTASLMPWPNRGRDSLQGWTRRTIVESLSVDSSLTQDEVWYKWATTMHSKAASDLWLYLDSINFWSSIYQDGAYSEVGFIKKPVIVLTKPVKRPGQIRRSLWVVQARILLSVRNSTNEVNQVIDVQFKLLQDDNSSHGSSVKIVEAWFDGQV